LLRNSEQAEYLLFGVQGTGAVCQQNQ